MMKRLVIIAGWGLLISGACTIEYDGFLAGGGQETGGQPQPPPSRSGMAPEQPDAAPSAMAPNAASDDGPPVPVDASAASDVQPAVMVADAGTPVVAPDAAPPPVAVPDAASPPVAVPDAGVPLDVEPVALDLAPPPPPPPIIVHTHDLTVRRLVAGVVYAHRLDAESGKIVTSGPPLSGTLLDAQFGQDLKVDELVVDILYAHDIHAGTVQIQEAHISDPNIKVPLP
jgi:hypothetical protein